MERKDWILAVLYSSGKTPDFNESINSSLRLMKVLFMLGQEKKDLSNFYDEWEKYLYGPCDFNVYDDLSELKSAGLIEEKEQPFQNFTVFNLTSIGNQKAKIIFDILDSPTKETIKEVKKEANSRLSLTRLLQYVYGKYPGWDTQSIFNLK